MSMGGSLIARAKPKEARITAVITRADGRVENLGTISYWHRNPLKRAWWQITKAFRDIITKLSKRTQP